MPAVFMRQAFNVISCFSATSVLLSQRARLPFVSLFLSYPGLCYKIILFPSKLQEHKIFSPHFSVFLILSPRFPIVLSMAGDGSRDV